MLTTSVMVEMETAAGVYSGGSTRDAPSDDGVADGGVGEVELPLMCGGVATPLATLGGPSLAFFRLHGWC
jgi:hypothetical protein